MASNYNIATSFIQNHKILTFVLIISLITFGMSIYSVYEIEKLKENYIDETLYLAGTDNNTLEVLTDFTTVYKFNTSNYDFSSFSNFSGHFRVLLKNLYGGDFSSLQFRITDDRGRNITSSDVVVPQSSMVINFKTVEYTEYLNLEAKINQPDIVLESLSIFAKGKNVKGFL